MQLRPFSCLQAILGGLFSGWVGLVCWLSSLSSSSFSAWPHFFDGFDKGVHGTLFFAGSILLTCAIWKTWRLSWMKVCGLSIPALSLFGWSDEMHQLFTAGRSGADFGDWTADFIGAIAGAAAVQLSFQVLLLRANAMKREAAEILGEWTG